MANTASQIRTNVTLGSAALVAVGVLFVVYPALRPQSDASGEPGPSAMAFASPRWLAAHVAAMVGLALLPAILLEIRRLVGRSTMSNAALAATSCGVGLLLPCFGTEAFAVHAVGQQMIQTGDLGLMRVVEAVRGGGLHIAMFGSGLILLASGAVLTAVAVWRSATRSQATGTARWSAVVFAAGFTLFVPGFFAPPVLRILDGALILVGCVVLASALRRSLRTEVHA